MKFLKNIDKIVKSYGVTNYMLETLRSVFKITSDTQTFILKRFKNTKKALNTINTLKHLKQRGFPNCQNFYYNLENEFYFCIEGDIYVCFEYIEGHEVNLKSIDDIKKSIKLLWDFSFAIKSIPTSFLNIEDKCNWVKEFNEDLYNLDVIERILIRKRNVDEGDKLYLKNIEKERCKITKTINFLKESEFEKDCYKNKVVCHNSLYYQNILINPYNIFLIDFGGMCFNHPIYDIGRFSKRVYYKNKGDKDILTLIFKECNKYYKFSEYETLLINSYISYPHKFIKIGVRKYIRNKPLNKEEIIKMIHKYC